jgi:hypothetical protein
MIAIARDYQPIEWRAVPRTSTRRCPPVSRNLRIAVDGWLIAASLGYLIALAGLTF